MLSLAFFLYCALLFVSPLPLGSNRVWAWGSEAILALLVLSLIILNAFLTDNYKRFQVLKRMKVELMLIGLWLLLHGLYLLPLPVEILKVFSPKVALAYADSGFDYGYLTLDYSATFATLMLSVYYFIILLLGVLLVDSRRKVHWVVLMFLAQALFQAVYGMYLVSINQTGLLFDRVTVAPEHLSGAFVNKNHVVAFLSMSFYMILASRLYFMKMWSFNSHSKRVWFLKVMTHPVRLFDLALLIIFSAIWATHSRAGLVSFFSGLFIFGLLYHFFLKKVSVNLKWFIGVFLVVFLILILVANDFNYFLGGLGLFQENSLEFLAKDVEGRKLALDQVIQHYQNYWLFGVGPGSYEVFFVNHRSVDQVAFFDHAHNDYAEFLIELGVFSLVLLAIALRVCQRLALNLIKSKSRLFRLLNISALVCVAYLLLHGTMDFNARIPANVVTLIVVVSLAYGGCWRKNPKL